MKKGVPEEFRFWDKVKIRPGCWIWMAGLNSAGYGQFRPSKAVIVYAHRYAFERFFGPIPEGKIVDHICHNTVCVNPNHLRLCTHQENIQNANLRRNSRSGVKGAWWDPKTNRWRSGVRANGKVIRLGRFDTPEEAHAAYCATANNLHGDFANFGENE